MWTVCLSWWATEGVEGEVPDAMVQGSLVH